MKKKLTALLLLLVAAPVGALLESCTEEDYPCQVGSAPRYYNVQGIALSAEHVAVEAGEAVEATKVRLVLELQKNYYGYRPAPAGWLPAAYACPPTPMPGYMGTDEILDSLAVRCVYAYDAAHPAGALVNDLLFSNNLNPLPTVPAVGARPNDLFLYLLQPPAQTGPQQFELRYRLTNGETYVARTAVLLLR